MDRKGAIELSANFIIVIVISMVIVASGLGLFFRIKANAQTYVDSLDAQTEEKIKAIMLSNNYKVAVYPQDVILKSGDSVLVGVGITNIYPEKKTYTVKLMSVKIYGKTPATDKVINTGTELMKYHTMTSPTIDIAPNTQSVKTILLDMPDQTKGEYVYTINISTDNKQFGIVQVYATN